jgi:hypothetical protein
LLTDAAGSRVTEALDLDLGARREVLITHAAGEDVARYGYEVPAATPSWKLEGRAESLAEGRVVREGEGGGRQEGDTPGSERAA